MKNLSRRPATDPAVDPTRDETAGARGLMRLGDLTRTWHGFRTVVAGAWLFLGLSFGAIWQWSGGLLIAGLAAVALLDVSLRRSTPTVSAVPSMLLDVTFIGATMVIVGLEPIGVGASLLYMLSIPVLLLTGRRVLPVIAYSVLWSAVAFVGIDVVPPPVANIDAAVTAVVAVIFGGHTLALLGVVTRELGKSHRAREQRMAYEGALARCGEALLASTNEGAIDVALEALLEAVPVQDIFVDKNFMDPDLGLCSRVTHERIRPGLEDLVDEEIWIEDDTAETFSVTVLPYSDMPTSYAALSAGEASAIVSSQLSGREREIYEEDGCKSELNIPIMVAGEWVGSIGLADYVTERHWSEDDLQILHTSAAMIGAFWERNRAYEELEEVIRSKDEFLASISHEIRTPLTVVLGFSSLLHQDSSAGLPPEAAAQVELISEQAQEVADIVEDLLVAARADIDELAVVQEAVDLRRETERVLTARANEKPHSIQANVDPIAWADPTRVRQIIRCLVSNAVRYGGDRIEIQIRQVDGRARIAVIDNGEGIPTEQQEQVFEAFHRAHTHDGRPQAIGLGLYVARHLARLMKGDLIHRQGKGLTAFELDLPLAPTAAKPETSSHDSLPIEAGTPMPPASP